MWLSVVGCWLLIPEGSRKTKKPVSEQQVKILKNQLKLFKDEYGLNNFSFGCYV